MSDASAETTAPTIDRVEQAERFRALHDGPEPLLIPNAWDAGSAKLLVAMGFGAVATTSSGFAASLGRLDGYTMDDEALANAAVIVKAAGTVPVSADLENGFTDEPAKLRVTLLNALGIGLAGCSIEDYTGRPDDPLYDLKFAAERVEAAATIARLQAYQEAGADVLFAPGLSGAADIRSVVSSVDRPVNVLALPNCPPVAELAEIGVRRISIGGAFAFAAYGAMIEAATELRDRGTYGYWARTDIGRSAVREHFGG